MPASAINGKKMNKLLRILTVFLLPAALASCSRPGCSQKAGNVARLERSMPPFSHVVVADNINIVFRQENAWRIVIETDENLLSAVSAEVTNDMLSIRNTASCSWIRRPGESITVYVSLPDLNRFEYQGSGTVTCADTLHLDYLSLEADHGAGNVHLLLDTRFTQAQINNEVTDLMLEGRSDSCWAWCASRGTIDFRNFRVGRMELAYAGVRDAFVWASESLRTTIYQTGNVYYKGTPALIAPSYRSSGRLFPLR
jgi:hypothetical protein